MTEIGADSLHQYIQNKRDSGHNYKGTPVYDVSKKDVEKLHDISNKHGIPVEWMGNLMNFESGGTFNPKITNSIGATGLIQFMPSTAKGLGTSTDTLRKMSFSEQLDYVDKFVGNSLKGKGVLNPDGKVKDTFTQQDLFMTIFYPVAVGKPDYKFPSRVQNANNGIATPHDYTAKALKNPPFPESLVPSSLKEYKKKFEKKKLKKPKKPKTEKRKKNNRVVGYTLLSLSVVGLGFAIWKITRK